jgi:hypothetical protein
MLRSLRIALVGITVCAFVGVICSSAYAGTIIKLSLGDDTPADIEFDGTTLSTIPDGDLGTTGDQNTSADFLDFLSFYPDILPPIGSFSLNGLTASGFASLFPIISPVLVIRQHPDGALGTASHRGSVHHFIQPGNRRPIVAIY